MMIDDTLIVVLFGNIGDPLFLFSVAQKLMRLILVLRYADAFNIALTSLRNFCQLIVFLSRHTHESWNRKT